MCARGFKVGRVGATVERLGLWGLTAPFAGSPHSGNWPLRIGHCVVRFQRTGLNLSATSIVSDRDPVALHDHRDSAFPSGVLKHALQPRRILGNVDVLEWDLPLAVFLPGGRGIGSCVLAEDQDRLSHSRTLLVWESLGSLQDGS